MSLPVKTYVCTGCPGSRLVCHALENLEGLQKSSCIGGCRYAPRIDIRKGDEVLKRYGGQKLEALKFPIEELGENIRTTIASAIEECKKE